MAPSFVGGGAWNAPRSFRDALTDIVRLCHTRRYGTRRRPEEGAGIADHAFAEEGQFARLKRYFQPIAAILRRMNAICVASGSSLGHTSWQASSDMQPNTPSSSPITS
jgi:hypothetical protein